MDEYRRRDYGAAEIGFDKRLGIAVVDFQLAFTDARFPLGGAFRVGLDFRNGSVLGV